jgi:hypothetical protein
MLTLYLSSAKYVEKYLWSQQDDLVFLSSYLEINLFIVTFINILLIVFSISKLSRLFNLFNSFVRTHIKYR